MTRNILLGLLFAIQTVVGCARPAFAMELDKPLHATTSACIYGAVYAIGNAHNHENPDPWLPLAVTLGLGLFKELTDPKFDEVDLMADGLGAGMAMMTLELTW